MTLTEQIDELGKMRGRHLKGKPCPGCGKTVPNENHVSVCLDWRFQLAEEIKGEVLSGSEVE